jgi:hypothetical protein
VDAILEARAGPAGLVLGVEFYHTAGEVRVADGVNVEPKTCPTKPGHAGYVAGRQKARLAGLGVSAFAQNISNSTRDTSPDSAARNQRERTCAIAALSTSMTARSS